MWVEGGSAVSKKIVMRSERDIFMKEYLRKWFRVNAGLFVFAAGLYFTIHASIGIAPWDALCMGLSGKTGLSYGTIYAGINVLILATDIAMHEPIGFGTLFDTMLTGYYVDFITWISPLPANHSLIIGSVMIIVGLFIMAVGQYIYIIAGQGCGPRDSLTIGIARRIPRLSVGMVQILIMLVVFVLALLVDGPIGLGTVLSVIFMGTAMQIVFGFLKFEPRDVVHENLFETVRRLSGGAG